MDAIILAGGLGTRLRKVLPDIPKPLAPVNGRPFLDALLEYLDCSENIGKVVLATGHLAEAIMDRYADAQYHFPIVFSREESLLGTGGAIKYALPLTSGDDVIVINGDTYADVDIRALLKFHREKNGAATIAVARACLKTLPYLRGVCSACEALVSTSMCCKHISVSDSASRRRTPAARFGNPGFETSSSGKM